MGTYLWLCRSQWKRNGCAPSRPEQNWKQNPPVVVSYLVNQLFRKERPRNKRSRKSVFLNTGRWGAPKLKPGVYFWKDFKDTAHSQQTVLLCVPLGEALVNTIKLHFTICSSASFHLVDLHHVETYIWAAYMHFFSAFEGQFMTSIRWLLKNVINYLLFLYIDSKRMTRVTNSVEDSHKLCLIF